MKSYKIRYLHLLITLAVLLQGPGAGIAFAAEQPAGSAAKAEQPIFADLPKTDGFYPYVRYLASREIMAGFQDGTFRHAQSLTRAEAAKTAVLLKELTLVDGGEFVFQDVPAEHWASSYIETAVKAGLFEGYPGGIFEPDQPLTRAEAAVLLTRLSGGALSEESMSIADVAPGHWAYKQVVTAVKAGLMALSSDQLFVPDLPLSRGELAQCLCTLATLSPELRAVELTGNLTVIKGRVTITGEDGTSRSAGTEETIGAGMTIATDGQGRAEIIFDDGSGILLEVNTEIDIVNSEGFRYMYTDGTPAVAVDRLEIKLRKGKIFGALATRYDISEASGNKGSALAEEPSAWWLYPYSKRERITVETPAGVTGIWGTFWSNQIGPGGGGSTSLLTGEAQVSSGGQTVQLSGGQSTFLQPSQSPASPGGAPPSPPAPMPPSQAQDWGSQGPWVQQRAEDIQSQTPALPPTPPPPPSSQPGAGSPPTPQPPSQPGLTPPTPPSPPPNLQDIINSALEQLLASGSAEPDPDYDPPSPPPSAETFTVTGESIHNGGDEIVLAFSAPMNPSTLNTDRIRAGSVATVIYTDDAAGTNSNTISLANAAGVWNDLNDEFAITLNELTDQAYIPGDKFLGVTLADTVRSAEGTAVTGARVYSLESIPGEETAPQFLSWGLDMDTGVISITFDEPVEPASLDLSKIGAGGEGADDRPALSGSSCLNVSFANTISIALSRSVDGIDGIYELFRSFNLDTLDDAQRSCYMELAAGAVGDLAGNASARVDDLTAPTDFTPELPRLTAASTLISSLETEGTANEEDQIILQFTKRMNADEIGESFDVTITGGASSPVSSIVTVRGAGNIADPDNSVLVTITTTGRDYSGNGTLVCTSSVGVWNNDCTVLTITLTGPEGGEPPTNVPSGELVFTLGPLAVDMNGNTGLGTENVTGASGGF